MLARFRVAFYQTVSKDVYKVDAYITLGAVKLSRFMRVYAANASNPSLPCWRRSGGDDVWRVAWSKRVPEAPHAASQTLAVKLYHACFCFGLHSFWTGQIIGE